MSMSENLVPHEEQDPTIDRLVMASEGMLAGSQARLGPGWRIITPSRRFLIGPRGEDVYTPPVPEATPDDPHKLADYLYRNGLSRGHLWHPMVRNWGGEAFLHALQPAQQQRKGEAPQPEGDVLYRLVIKVYDSEDRGPRSPYESFLYSSPGGLLVYSPSKALKDTLDRAIDNTEGVVSDVSYETDPMMRALAYVEGDIPDTPVHHY